MRLDGTGFHGMGEFKCGDCSKTQPEADRGHSTLICPPLRVIVNGGASVSKKGKSCAPEAFTEGLLSSGRAVMRLPDRSAPGAAAMPIIPANHNRARTQCLKPFIRRGWRYGGMTEKKQA